MTHLNRKNVEAATKRRNLVLTFMQKAGLYYRAANAGCYEGPGNSGDCAKKTNQEGMPYEAFFLDAATREVESELKDVDIRTDGLQIYLTLDSQAQQYSDAIMNTQGVVRYPNERFQAAFVLLDSKNG
ncbi:hypothetical protein GCM10020331_092810 [Ectobacillus funiculus]